MEVNISGKIPMIRLEAQGANAEIILALAMALNIACTKEFGRQLAEMGARSALEVVSKADRTEIDLSDMLRGGDRR